MAKLELPSFGIWDSVDISVTAGIPKNVTS